MSLEVLSMLHIASFILNIQFSPNITKLALFGMKAKEENSEKDQQKVISSENRIMSFRKDSNKVSI